MRIAWNKGLHTGLIPKTAFKKGMISPRKGKKGKPLSLAHRRAISEGIKRHLPKTAWQKGQHFSPQTEFKKGQTAGEKNHWWKGDKVGYFALHNWIQRKFEWANKSGEYKRDLTDWIRLCTPCHAKYDDYVNKAWITRKQKYGDSGRRDFLRA